MKEFILLYRNPVSAETQISQEEMQKSMNEWTNWFKSIEAQGKLVTMGNQIGPHGKTVMSNLVSDEPFVENNQFVGGYSILKSDSLDDAVKVAKSCPIFKIGGTVEVRDIVKM